MKSFKLKILILLCALFFSRSVEAQLEEDYFKSGKYDFKHGDFSQAVIDFKKAIEINPDDAQAYEGRGAAYLYQGNLPQAIVDLNKAIVINPNYAEAYNDRGVAYGKQLNFAQAGVDFNKAIEIDPNYAEAYDGRGAAYLYQGNLPQAIVDLNKAIAINPKRVEAYRNRGIAYEKLKKFDRAIADYTKAIEIYPNYALAYANRGLVYVKQNNLDQSVSDFTHAIEINPNYAEAYYARGVIYAKKGQLPQAINDLNKAIEIKPAYAEAYNLRGDLQDNGLSRNPFIPLFFVFTPFLLFVILINFYSIYFTPIRKAMLELGGKINWKGEAVFPFQGKEIHVRYISGNRNRMPRIKIFIYGVFGGDLLIRRKESNDNWYQEIGLNRELSISNTELNDRFYFECDDQEFLNLLFINPDKETKVIDILGHYSDIEISPRKCLLTKFWSSSASLYSKENFLIEAKELLELSSLIPSVGGSHPDLVRFKIKRILLYFLGSITLLIGVASWILSSYIYRVVDDGRLWVWSLSFSVPIALVFTGIAFGIIKGFSSSSKVFIYFMITFCIGALLCGRYGIAVYNGRYDKSPVKEFHSTVLSKYITSGSKGGTYYHVALEPWRAGMNNWNITINQSSYATIVPGSTQYQILTRAGRLGFEWVTAQRRIYYLKPRTAFSGGH